MSCGSHHVITWAGDASMIPRGTPCDCGQKVLELHICPSCGFVHKLFIDKSTQCMEGGLCSIDLTYSIKEAS